jgi:hypothetical protein
MCVRMCGLRRPSSCPTSVIAVEKVVVEVGWRAIQRRTRSELLLFYFTFNGLGERTIPTPHASTLARLPCAHIRTLKPTPTLPF